MDVGRGRGRKGPREPLAHQRPAEAGPGVAGHLREREEGDLVRCGAKDGEVRGAGWRSSRGTPEALAREVGLGLGLEAVAVELP